MCGSKNAQPQPPSLAIGTYHALQHVYGQWEDDGGVLLCSDGGQGLQIAELKSSRGLRNNQGRLFQGPGSIHLTLCCDHLGKQRQGN